MFYYLKDRSIKKQTIIKMFFEKFIMNIKMFKTSNVFKILNVFYS